MRTFHFLCSVMKSVIVSILLASFLSFVVGESCFLSEEIRMCAMKTYHSNDLLNPATYNQIEIHFVKIQGETNLTAPQKFSNKGLENAVYKSVSVAESCIANIEDDFFKIIDRNNSALHIITFKNVSCLKKLSSKSFGGIGRFLKTLSLDIMRNLVAIDFEFFDTLVVLETLTISDTGIHILPEHMLTKMPRLINFNILSNKLTSLPIIPIETSGSIKIQAYNNPLDCRCSLKAFVTWLKSASNQGMYKCYSPDHLKGMLLVEADLCPSNAITSDPGPKTQLKVGHSQDEKAIVKAGVRIEIIVAASVMVLVIVIVVIVVVMYKRHKKPPKQKVVYEQTSPSKIIFQNDADQKAPFMFKYDT